MTFEAKYDNPVVMALQKHIVDGREASLPSNPIFSGNQVEMEINRDSRYRAGGLGLTFPCHEVKNPVDLVSVKKGGYIRFTFQQNPDYPPHVLKFVSEKGFHKTFLAMYKVSHISKKEELPFEIPGEVNGEFSYRTYLGEWNALPTGLLKKVSGFLFESSGATVRWPIKHRDYSAQGPDDETKLGVKYDCYGEHSKDYKEKREAFIQNLNKRGIIKIETVQVSDGKTPPTQKEKLFLTNPNKPYEVMREIEDQVRKTGGNPAFHGGVGLSFSGAFSLTDILEITPDIFDKRLEKGKLECGKFTLKRHNESAFVNSKKTQVYVNGDLETAARIGSALSTDYELLAENTGKFSGDREVLKLKG